MSSLGLTSFLCPTPQGLDIQVWRRYEDFVAELSSRFPHEAAGIQSFYDTCWKVFDALNSIELKSLEEPRYLMEQFSRSPIACLTLAYYSTSNTGGRGNREARGGEGEQLLTASQAYRWGSYMALMGLPIHIIRRRGLMGL